MLSNHSWLEGESSVNQYPAKLLAVIDDWLEDSRTGYGSCFLLVVGCELLVYLKKLLFDC